MRFRSFSDSKKDIILGGNHSQMAALNLRSRLADALLSIEESSKVRFGTNMLENG